MLHGIQKGSRRDRLQVVGWFGTCCRLVVAVLVGAAFFAPVVAAFASHAPLTADAVTPRHQVIRVQPFGRPTHGCFPLPREPYLLVGPINVAGSASTLSWLDRGISRAMHVCSPEWKGGVTVEVSVDQTGRINRVVLDRDAGPRLAACVAERLRSGFDDEEGPHAAATLRAGYLMTLSE